MPTNRRDDRADAVTTVDLARENDFALGQVVVSPATLSVVNGATAYRLEPRVMQVLVVLAQASGVVGRAELNERVWGGRVVGDDAVNRAIQTLRRLAAEIDPPAFAIETIPRIGYRMKPASDVGSSSPAIAKGRGNDAAPGAHPRQKALILATSVLCAIGGAMTLWYGSSRHDGGYPRWRIANVVALDDLPPDAQDAARAADGRRFIYAARDPQGHSRVFLRGNPAAGPAIAVSPAGLDARRPTWSPDGRSVAFIVYDPDRPCRLYVAMPSQRADVVGTCETEREPRIAWSADGRSLLLGDKPGQNAVLRIAAMRLGDGRRDVVSSPPGNSVGDDLPVAVGDRIIFRRRFDWADEAWVARDTGSGTERTLWHHHGLIGSIAAAMPDGTLAVAWMHDGTSRLDIVDPDGRIVSQPVTLGPVSGLSTSGASLLIEIDRTESALMASATTGRAGVPLAALPGRITSPVVLAGGTVRFAVITAGQTRLWQSEANGSIHPWGHHVAVTIAGLALSPDRSRTAALSIGATGSEIIVLDANGHPQYRWNPRARKLNPAAWSGDGRSLIVPVLDNAGWRLWSLDPFDGAPPHDLSLPGFAVVQSLGSALYAVRAGETTGLRELWRLDGHPRRLPFDLTLFDIVNWAPAETGVWLPDRSDRYRPRLVLRQTDSGRVLRSIAASGLAGAGSRLAVGRDGPLYVRTPGETFDHALLSLEPSRLSGLR